MSSSSIKIDFSSLSWDLERATELGLQVGTKEETPENNVRCSKEKDVWYPSSRFMVKSETQEFYSQCLICQVGGLKQAKGKGLLVIPEVYSNYSNKALRKFTAEQLQELQERTRKN